MDKHEHAAPIDALYRTSAEAKLRSIFEGLLHDLKFAEADLQVLAERPMGIREDLIDALNASIRGLYANEEMESPFGYPEGYAIKPLAKQAALLRRIFPELQHATYDKRIARKALPTGAERWFAIPRWTALAETYHDACERVLETIRARRECSPFYDHTVLQQEVRTAFYGELLADQQSGHDILVIPAQFGIRHCGRSNRRARERYADNEFGLGVVAVGSMLLTHPKRESVWEQLHLSCPGDVTTPRDPSKACSPLFVCGDTLAFSYANSCSSANRKSASATAFIP